MDELSVRYAGSSTLRKKLQGNLSFLPQTSKPQLASHVSGISSVCLILDSASSNISPGESFEIANFESVLSPLVCVAF